MKFTVVATEAMSLLSLGLILYGSLFEISRKVRKNNVYTAQVLLCVMALFADMMAWIIDGTQVPEPVIFLSDLLTFVLGYVIIASYSIYIIETLKEKRPVSPWLIKAVVIATGVACVVVVICSLTGHVFSIQDHSYVTGPWYPYTHVFTNALMALNLWLILSNSKVYGFHDTVALMAYIIFPVGATLLHYVVPQISLTFIGSMFSQFMVYIMLQAEQESEFREKERLMIEVSRTDTLTGLQNRRAYTETLDKVKNEETVGIVFLDINGLKYTNDNLGHEAGDALISGFSSIVTKHFPYDEVFRISGDEFVVIKAAVKQKELEHTADLLKKAQVKDGRPIAAVGLGYGPGYMVGAVVNDAETKMYEDKELFYEKWPHLRRS